MKNFYAVDPGKDYFAWALVHERQIACCGLSKESPRRFFAVPTFYPESRRALVIEHQRILPGKEKYGNDIVDLARSAGKVAGQFDDENVTWAPLLNFTKPKRGEMSIPEARCRKYMTPAELALFVGRPKKELEHLWDAGYFALKYADRLNGA